MKRLFRLTPEASSDLREILLDIAVDSPDTADAGVAAYSLERLKNFGAKPLGHYHEELLDRRYRFWNFYSYVVCYVWEKKPIQIIAVVLGRAIWLYPSRPG